MKLLNFSAAVEPKYKEVGGYKPGFLGKLFGLPIIKATLIPTNKNYEHTTFSQVHIDFEESPCELNIPYHLPIAFGDRLHKNVTPVEHIRDNIYKCTIGSIEPIRIEQGYTYDY